MAEIDARLAAIAERFAAQTGEAATAICAALDAGNHAELARLAHSMAGRAGMFGYGAIGDAARAVEEAVDGGKSAETITKLTRDLLDRLAMLARA
jgi:HPt (histidine-containing phosphotransfer) domain-containing protein